MSQREIAAQLSTLPADVTLRGVIGHSGNLLLTARVDLDEAGLRRLLEQKLSCPCVAIDANTLRAILKKALDTIRAHEPLADPGYRVKIEGTEWEAGLVLASDRLMDKALGETGTFPSTNRAIPLRFIDHRALLVLKLRWTKTRRSRIPWGDAVNEPVRKCLDRLGVPVGCVTSRSLGSVAAIVRAADLTEFGLPEASVPPQDRDR